MLGVLTTIKKKGPSPAAALGERVAPRLSICVQVLPLSLVPRSPLPTASSFSSHSRLGQCPAGVGGSSQSLFVSPDGSTYAEVSLAPG